MQTIRIPEKKGLSFRIKTGETFQITDPNGGMVADLVAFNEEDTVERFSPKYTYRRDGRVRISTGDTLYTTEGRPILTITDDDCGTHELLRGPCNHWILRDYYEKNGSDGCRENLTQVLKPEGIGLEQLNETMNVFMKSTLSEQTYLDTREAQSVAGDTIAYRAEMDAIVGISACPAYAIRYDEQKPLDITLPSDATIHKNF